MALVTACIAPTDTPAIQVRAHGTLATELEVGEADRTVTVLAALRNAVYDLDVDVAAALDLPTIDTLDTLLEQLRAAVHHAGLQCEHPSCVSHQIGAAGYCIEHGTPDTDDLPDDDEDGRWAALEAEQRARHDLTPAAHARAALASAIDRDYGGAL